VFSKHLIGLKPKREKELRIFLVWQWVSAAFDSPSTLSYTLNFNSQQSTEIKPLSKSKTKAKIRKRKEKS
jgi:hypothetical protein